MIKKIYDLFKNNLKLESLAKIIGILIIIYLFSLTNSTFRSIFDVVIKILKPFILGFVIAYICEPLIEFFEAKKVKRSFVVLMIWIILIVILIAFFLVLIPMLYDKVSQLINSLIFSVEYISSQIIKIADYDDFSLVHTITNTITNFLQTYESWLPKVVGNIPTWMSVMLSFITDSIFTVIIAIYFQLDFKRIKTLIKKIAIQMYADSEDYLREIDIDLQVYIKSVVIMVVIRFAIYSLFYFALGHSDWLIIGFITSIACIIPYIGGTLANILGIITALTLSPFKIMMLVIGLIILSNVDGYIISPIVHQKRSALGPLMSLLVIFAGGILFHMIGIMVALPCVIAIRSCFEVYERKYGKLF